MVSRLFGRTKKPTTPQEPQPPICGDTEDEGFTIIGDSSPPQPLYPSLAGFPAPAQSTKHIQPTLVHYLDGVPFVLSSQVMVKEDGGGGGTSDTISTLSSRINAVSGSAFVYDFRIERSVLQDIQKSAIA